MSPLLFPFKILRFFVFVIVGAILVSVISPNEMSENPPTECGEVILTLSKYGSIIVSEMELVFNG